MGEMKLGGGAVPSSGSEKPCTQGFLLCHYHTRDSARGNVSSTLRGAYS